MESSPEWYEIIAGIIAIPAGIIGLLYSYFLIKKVNLESKKIELEILEKNKLISREVDHSMITKTVTKELKTNQFNSILLKFVLLYLILLVWGFITEVFNFLSGGIYLFSEELFGIPNKNEWHYQLSIFLLQQMPQIIRYLIIILVGIPLIREINRYLNIDLKAFLKIR